MIRAKIKEPGAHQGWRYRLWFTQSNGHEIEMLRVNTGGLPEYPPTHPQWKHEYKEGDDYERHDADLSKDGKGGYLIEHPVHIDEDIFVRARLEFEYYPDRKDHAVYAELNIEQAPWFGDEPADDNVAP